MKKFNLILIFLILSLIVFFFSSVVLATSQPPREPFTYHLMVPLPTAAGTATSTTGIVDYIRILYFFGIGISAVVAMGAIIIAGFQWVTAGGSFAQVKSAKDRMSNALLGLVILLASFLILNTINPALVTLKEPYLYFIDWGSAFPTDSGATSINPGGGSQFIDCQDVIDQGGDCAAYRSAFGGLLSNLPPARETAFINYCNNDLCGLGLNCRFVGGILTPYPFGGCVDNTSTSSFDNHVCSLIGNCSDYTRFSYMSGVPSACSNNLCGVSAGPCFWTGIECLACSSHSMSDCSEYTSLSACVTNGCGLNSPNGCFWQSGACENR